MEDYPDIDDPDFQQLIAQRLEFRNLHNIDGLYSHQEFVRRFMSPYTPYKSLILYHSLGSGKSIACIAVAVDHFLHSKKRCIIVTKGDSGTDNFKDQIELYRCMSVSGKNDLWNMSMFTMKHYISLSNQISNMSNEDITDAFSNCIIVLDEVHNVRYFKKETEDSVYGSIVRILKLCTGVKIIIATATPMTDNHEQIRSLLGMCNHSRDDKHSMNGIISYNCAIQDRPDFHRKGTFKYVPGVRVWPSDMMGHQKLTYSKEDTDKPPDDIYRKLTHISLFCFEDGTHGREITEYKMKKTKTLATITSMSTRQTKQIKYVKYSVLPEFSACLTGEALRESSSKYSATIELLENSTGNVFIFIEEVKGSGLLLLASILEHHGYELYLGDNIENMRPKKRYTMCVGSSDISPNNSDRLEGFNCDLNKHGDYVRVLLGSRVIGESITLKNVRQFYCLTPHWNDSTIDQAIGRVIRNKSHAGLEEKDRNVDIYIHVSVYPDNPNNSVDIKKLSKCKDKEKDIRQVSMQMIDYAVDRYCLPKNDKDMNVNIPILHVDLFAAAYIHHYEKDIARSILRALSNPMDIFVLSNMINVHPTVCQEVLCRMIFYNERVGDRFIRAYGDTVFLVDDPSIPYVTVPKIYTAINRPNKSNAILPDGRALLSGIDTTFPHAIQTFRHMQAKEKAAFLEYCIQHDVSDVLEQIHTTFAEIDGTTYHLLLYRNLENSYTSSNPVPKTPLGKTRAFNAKNRTWWTVDCEEDERHIFDAYRAIVSDALEQADKNVKIYGVISTIDGDMRLRLRDDDERHRSLYDRRYIRRGKNIRSIKKDVLLTLLFEEFGIYANSLSVNEIVDIIDRTIIESKLYIVL